MTFSKILALLLSSASVGDSFSLLTSTTNRRGLSLFQVDSKRHHDLLDSLNNLRTSRFLDSKANATFQSVQMLCSQYFVYIPREEEAKIVVNLMTQRQNLRLEGPQAVDKKFNDLIAVPGSPGIGKSAFLTNFPHSKAYKEYLNGKSPIVSAFTFNGFMDGPGYLGMRIVFGACNAMGLIPYADDAWSTFFESYIEYFPEHHGEAKYAVKLLREVFGDDRPILILIDEISKAKDDSFRPVGKEITGKIGALLDMHGDVDVVVSSLEPQYIRDLLTGSQRKVRFVILPTMFKHELGKKECWQWADEVIEESGSKNIPLVKQNLLRNAYRLYSAHPRSLEYMASEFENNNNTKHKWSELARSLVKTDTLSLLRWLTYNLSYNTDCRLDSLTDQELEDHVFSTPSTADIGSLSLRTLVNIGNLFVQGKDEVDEVFYTSVQAMPLLKLIHKLSRNEKITSPFLSVLRVLFIEISSNKSLSSLWERIVDLSLVTRSYTSFTSISEIFGITLIRSECLPAPVNWRIAEIMKEKKVGEIDVESMGNCLVIPPEKTAGYDSFVHFSNTKERFYLQMKIDPPIGKPLSTLIGGVVVNVLVDHYKRTCFEKYPLSSLYVVLYVWGGDDAYSRSLDRYEVKKTAAEKYSSLLEQGAVDISLDLVNRYIDEHWEHIHIVGQSRLQNWLNPSLVPIACLVQEAKEDNLT